MTGTRDRVRELGIICHEKKSGSCCEGGGRKAESLTRRFSAIAIINNKLYRVCSDNRAGVATEYQVISFSLVKHFFPFPAATSSPFVRARYNKVEKETSSFLLSGAFILRLVASVRAE